jgi:hypothetical protein
MTVSEAPALPASDGPGIGGVRAVALTAETVNEYIPGQYSPVFVVSSVRVELPEPVPIPGGVDTGLDENDPEVPESPERVRE